MDILESILTNFNLWGAIASPLVAWLIIKIPDLAENRDLLVGTFITIVLYIVKQLFDNRSKAVVKAAEIHANALVAAAAVGPTVVTPTEVRQEYPFQGGSERG